MIKSQNMMIVGAVCARGGSKGVPRKNLRKIAGKTLVAHAVECARACPSLGRVVVSTDDSEIAEEARRAGADVPFLRPDELARDDTSKWEVFRHLVRMLEKENGRRVDMLVDLDAGVPLRISEDVEACVQKLQASDADIMVTAYEPDRNPYFNMVEVGKDGLARVSKPVTPPITGRQQAPKVYGLTPSVYVIRREALDRIEHWSQGRMLIHVVPRARALDIDTDLDFRFVEYLMNSGKTK